MLDAARELFVEQGYGRTTIADVARAAGVSVETVYGAFGNKATLLHRAWDVTIGGDDEEITYHERPEILALRAEPDLARRFAMQAALFTQTARRIVPFLLAVQGAAATEPAAAEMLAEMGRQRLEGLSVMAREAAATGQLAVSEQDCRDIIWATHRRCAVAAAGQRTRLVGRAVPGRGSGRCGSAPWLLDSPTRIAA